MKITHHKLFLVPGWRFSLTDFYFSTPYRTILVDFIDRRWSETFKVSLKIKFILSKTAFFSSVDIDDIFVGDSGTRLGKSDVSAMIDFTNKLGSLWFP